MYWIFPISIARVVSEKLL